MACLLGCYEFFQIGATALINRVEMTPMPRIAILHAKGDSLRDQFSPKPNLADAFPQNVATTHRAPGFFEASGKA